MCDLTLSIGDDYLRWRNIFHGNTFRSVRAAGGWERVVGARGWWERSLRVRYRTRLGATVFQKFPCGSLTLSTSDRACYQTVTRVGVAKEGYVRRSRPRPEHLESRASSGTVLAIAAKGSLCHHWRNRRVVPCGSVLIANSNARLYERQL